MGNNLGVGSLIPSSSSNGSDSSFHLQLGTSATIDITGKEVENKTKREETRKASYTVDGLTCDCELDLIKFSYGTKYLIVRIRDDMFSPDFFEIRIEGGGGHRLWSFYSSLPGSFDDMVSTKTTSVTSHPGRGGVTTKTKVHLYGNGSRGGLIVVERKKRKEGMWHQRLYEITVAHYYAFSTGDIFSKNRADIGLSMVAKIEQLDDGRNVDLTWVEGPVRHPAAALFYMFEQVFRTGIWKPTSCPHCANFDQRRRRSSGISMLRQPGSDKDSDSCNVNAARQNILSNNGMFRGNHNGNLMVRNLFLGG